MTDVTEENRRETLPFTTLRTVRLHHRTAALVWIQFRLVAVLAAMLMSGIVSRLTYGIHMLVWTACPGLAFEAHGRYNLCQLSMQSSLLLNLSKF